MLLAVIHDAPTNPVGACVFLAVFVLIHAAIAIAAIRANRRGR